jgi:hypothetical protein
MSWNLLLLLSPFYLVVLVYGLIVVVALLQARHEDIPAVLRHCVWVFSQLVSRLPDIRPKMDPPPPSITSGADDNQDEDDSQIEEAP